MDLLLPAIPLLLAATSAAQSPAIDYELTQDAAHACWRVRFQATGIDRAAGDVCLELQDWGEWTQTEDYLRDLSVRPPVRADPAAASRFLLDAPPGWDGRLEGSYVLPVAARGSPAHQAHGLLPHSDGSIASGFSSNTLVDVLQGGQPLDAQRTLRFSADPGVSVATGWAGVSSGEQTVTFRHPIDNVPLFFGSARTAAAEGDGLRYEVVQLGAGPDATAAVLEVVRTLVPLYARNCGRTPEEAVRLFIRPWEGGGVRTDHGCIVGAPGELEDGLAPDYVRLVAHELFHIWLGGYLSPDDESLVWFHEGFTEYCAVWHVAASGLASREWFAERIAIMDAEARASEAYGRVAFADPAVSWRDDNGPNETLGYRGGALLAFAADQELRRQGRPGLLQMLADLMPQDDHHLELPRIRSWMESSGLKDFYARSIQEPATFPEPDAALASLGFELSETPASLTYLGIEVEGDAPAGRVVAVDPSGPAAQAVKLGDQILGCSPTRSRPPRIGKSVATPYRFGLSCIASGAEVAELDVVRDGAELKLSVTPRLIEGGVRTAYRTGGEKLDGFFEHRPRPK